MHICSYISVLHFFSYCTSPETVKEPQNFIFRSKDFSRYMPRIGIFVLYNSYTLALFVS